MGIRPQGYHPERLLYCHPEGGTTEGSFPLVPVKILRLRLRILTCRSGHDE